MKWMLKFKNLAVEPDCLFQLYALHLGTSEVTDSLTWTVVCLLHT